MQKINLENHKHRLESLARKPTTDFPSAEHELAFEIAIYFNEGYSFWVRKIQKTKLLMGQVEKEFRFVQSQPWGKRQQVRILMSILFP